MPLSELLLSGWAQPGEALHPVAGAAALAFDYSAHGSVDAAFAALAPYRAVPYVVAWSMGGQMALKAIAAGVLAPKHLTLIAAPVQFVSDAAFGSAMDPLTFTQFRENYAANPTRTKMRFHGLVAKGDRDFSRVLSALTHHPEVENVARWLPWLDTLGAESLRDADFSQLPPTLIVHGLADAIVNPAQASHLAQRLPQAALQHWPEVGHAPHLHDPVRLRAAIETHRAAFGVADV